MQRAILMLLIIVTIVSSILLVHHYQTAAWQHSACVDIPANPDYLATNSEHDAVAAINHARAQEHLGPLRLPGNFYRLDPAAQQFILINLERKDRGLQPLHLDANLSYIAWAYSKQLRDLLFFSHTSPIAGTLSDRLNSNAAIANHYALAAENLAGNPVPGPGAMYEYMYDDAVEACGHRSNLLDPQLTDIGIGWVAGGAYGSISAQEFIASAPWNPYAGATPSRVAPKISIVGEQCAAPTSNCRWQNESRTGRNELPSHVQYRAIIHNEVGMARITWFLDHFGNQPSIGPVLTLDLSRLAPGAHTLLVYAVDGEQNYGTATYKIVV